MLDVILLIVNITMVLSLHTASHDVQKGISKREEDRFACDWDFVEMEAPKSCVVKMGTTRALDWFCYCVERCKIEKV